MNSEWTLSCSVPGPGIADYLGLMLIGVFAVTCFTLWRIFITNRGWPQRNLLVLNLKGSSADSESLDSDNSTYNAVFSIARIVVTFSFGLLAVELLQQLLYEMSFLPLFSR